MERLKKYIRSVPDFPKPGINFYDITTLILNPDGFELAVSGMTEIVSALKADKIIGIEARGFIFSSAIAARLHLPLALARKPGKLPARTLTEEYKLEYGVDRVEMHIDAVSKGDKVIVVDDLIATGGTVLATCKLAERLGGSVVGVASVIGLDFLPSQDPLKDYDIRYLITYDSE